MNEDYVSRSIYYFAVNIMQFIKNEMKLREIIALKSPQILHFVDRASCNDSL
jgi:hypothetical protein